MIMVLSLLPSPLKRPLGTSLQTPEEPLAAECLLPLTPLREGLSKAGRPMRNSSQDCCLKQDKGESFSGAGAFSSLHAFSPFFQGL